MKVGCPYQAADPLASQSAWVKRRRIEVNQIASAALPAPEQPGVLPPEAKRALEKLGKTATCQSKLIAS